MNMNLPFKDIPETCTVLGAFAGIKALDEEGRVCWFSRYSPDLNDQEIIGQLEIMSTQLVQRCIQDFEEG